MVALFPTAAAVVLGLPAVLAQLPSSSEGVIVARQISVLEVDPSTVSAECQLDSCLSFVKNITNNGCLSVECLCTGSVAAGMEACMKCERDNDVPGYDEAGTHDTMQIFLNGCKTANIPISEASINSTGSSSSNSTSSSSPTSTSSSGLPDTTTLFQSSSSSVTVDTLWLTAAVALVGVTFV